METHCIELIEDIKDLIEGGKKLFVSNRVGVDKEAVLMLLDELIDILPMEISQATALYKDSRNVRDSAEREADKIIDQASREADDITNKAQSDAQLIVEDAQSEAQTIIAKAKEEQKAMINEHQITLLANQKAEQIVLQAGKKAADIKQATMKYLDERLSYASEVLGRTYHEIEDNRKSL